MCFIFSEQKNARSLPEHERHLQPGKLLGNFVFEPSEATKELIKELHWK
jgi:hypothetical protein